MIFELVITTLLFAQQDITLPDSIKGEPGVFIPITAVTKGEIVQFVPLDSGLSVFPPNLLTDKKTTVVVAAKSGRYRVLAYTSINNLPSSPAITTLVVGVPDDKPPEPKPPEPKPPEPKPPEPKPDPEFADALKSIYGGLQEEDKAESLKKLLLIYEYALKEVDNKTYNTSGSLFSAIRMFSAKTLKKEKIDAIRETISNKTDEEVGKANLDPTTVLTDDLRKKIKNNFDKIVTILRGLNV